MAQRLFLALMVLWCVGAIGWFLLRDGADEPPTALAEPAALVDDSAPVGPSLAARPSAVGTASGSSSANGDKDPDWLRVTVLSTPEERARFLVWLREDPSRILALLRSRLSQPERFSPGIAALRRKSLGLQHFIHARGLRRFFRPLAGQLDFLMPTLKAELGRPVADASLAASVLAVLSVMKTVEGEGYGEVMALLNDEAGAPVLRLMAANAVLGSLGATPAVLNSVKSFLARPSVGSTLRMEYLLLMKGIRELGPEGRSLVPTLLQMLSNATRIWGLESETIRALVAIAPGDPEVRLRLVNFLHAGSASVQELAREVLLSDAEQGHRTLLYLLTRADGRTRVAGIYALLEQGHPPEDLGPLLMPALTDKSPDVRRKAVSLLGKVGRDVHEILPALRELLAAEHQDRWLTGVRALGALCTVAGDRDAVLQLLFVAVRLPNSHVRKVAVQSLLMFDEHAERVIPLLADLLSDTEADVRREAVDGLGELAAHDEAAEAHLRRALGDSDEGVRALARYWLSEDEDEDEDDD